MNKFFKNINIVILVFLFFNCTGAKQAIKINQANSDYDVVIQFAKGGMDDVINIKFPNQIIIKNNSFSKRYFNLIKYTYKNIPNNRDYGIGLFQQDENSLKKIKNNSKKNISPYGQLQYIYYTRHFVDSSKNIQDQFNIYIQKKTSKNKDTLHIGTVSDFKKNHKELFERLIKNDSISVQFLDGNKFGERISVPVEW
ncbi:hypothetical protein I2486_15225 [Cellulophaga sp. E16_2]|uniref:hypothetical protein n=1 Tax=Cellulophaga sp. E16_2 TaxID=2789297 RepID=UPI001A910182|nr:hypothetical protein [Cellulophaga sp. E16_2]MBO0592754.1 hypothetical protein [Cellulophaga sp. E16_2]